MQYTFVTIFPSLIEPYFKESILKRALEQKIIKIDFINPRDFTNSKHFKVDDTPYSGGAGMVFALQPIWDAISSIKTKDKDAYIVFLTPSAKSFNQKDSIRLAKKKHLVFVSGRYEGIDERVIEKWADEVLSVGDYILTGGELASLILADTVARNIDGVLGNRLSLEQESFNDGFLEPPIFTKPAKINKLSVISEYLKGNHSKIHTLKKNMSILRTKYYRPDLLARIENEK